MGVIWQEVRAALRTLAKAKGLSIAAVLILALGIGATTTVFSVAYGLFLQALPYPNPEQLVQVGQLDGKERFGSLSDPNFEDLRDQNHSLQSIAEFNNLEESVAGGSEPVRAMVATVSREFFQVMGVQPFLGRGFSQDEQREGAAHTAVVSYSYWQQYLSGDTDLARHPLRISGAAASVVGVMPPGFDFPAKSSLWVPRGRFPRVPSRTALNWQGVARIKDGVTLGQARADLSNIARRLKRELGSDTWMSDAAANPLREQLVGTVRPALLILLGATAFLMLLACANVANLLLARAVARRRELAVRIALGASRWRITRQLVAEAFCLCAAGALLGVLGAYWGVQVMVATNAAHLPRANEIRVNWAVLLFAAAVTLASSAIIGFVAAWRAVRLDPQQALQEGERAGGGESVERVRGALVVAQLAISLLLLAGAGLFARSFVHVLDVNPGFRVAQILTMHISLDSSEGLEAGTRRSQFVGRVLAGLRALPGVESVGAVSDLPLEPDYRNGVFLVMNPGEEFKDFRVFERLAKDPARAGTSLYRVASPDYFSTMGIRLLRGRMFDEADTSGAPHAVLISEALAQSKWPGQDPLGKLIEFGNMDGDTRVMTVVGVVSDVHDRGLTTPIRPAMYGDYRQRVLGSSDYTVVIRSALPPATLVPEARSLLWQLDPSLPAEFQTLEHAIDTSVADRRFNLTLLGFFAGAAALLAALGVYGVMAYSVTRRTHEIGIRRALGAAPADVLGMVLRSGARLALVGIAIGIAGALAFSRLIAGLLFGVAGDDPLTLAGVSVLLAVVTLAACYVPGLRAARVNPMEALRHE